MARRGSRIRVGMLVGAGLLAPACAAQPPSLPGGAATFGDSSDGPTPVGMGDVDEDEGGHEGGDDASSPDSEGSSGGADPGGIDADTDAADDGAGETGSSTGEATGTTGDAVVWFAGHYEGTWDGDCPSPIPISGGGTWSVDVDDDGDIDGSFSGNLSGQGVGGNITGSVDEQGNTVATASGPTLGECDWDGLVRSDGDADGDLDCSLGCSGEWSGSKS